MTNINTVVRDGRLSYYYIHDDLTDHAAIKKAEENLALVIRYLKTAYIPALLKNHNQGSTGHHYEVELRSVVGPAIHPSLLTHIFYRQAGADGPGGPFHMSFLVKKDGSTKDHIIDESGRKHPEARWKTMDNTSSDDLLNKAKTWAATHSH
jgi:hypothetical protein